MFVQLTKDDCQYLLTLIQEMDSETLYTARQRAYTIPKLQQIQIDGRSKRLAFQDVEYLLDLIEDDDYPELEQQRELTKQCLLDIQELQLQRREETRSIDEQREQRRLRRKPASEKLQEHFQKTQ